MKKIDYLNTFEMDKVYDYEYYRSDCLDSGLDEFDIADEDSPAFCEWVSMMQQQEINDFFENVRWSKYNTRCITVGQLGLWDGRHEIIPDFADTLYEAIRKCLDDSDSFVVTKNHSKIEVEVHHHDGCNRFDIYILSDKGIDRYYRNGCCSVKNRENIKTLEDYLF